MSTTFEVFPTIDRIPTFGDLIDAMRARAKVFFGDFALGEVPSVHVTLVDPSGGRRQVAKHEQLQWPEASHAWFQVEGVDGGTDAYLWPIDDINREYWSEILRDLDRARAYSQDILSAQQVGHYWHFRRSAGQPPMINILYGFLAAGLADLTKGVIYSDDAAWDYECFPCAADAFSRCYFRPAMARGADYRIWAEECLAQIRDDMSGDA